MAATKSTIFRWNPIRGFGFAMMDGQQIFVHYSVLRPTPPRGLDITGHEIWIEEVVAGDKGLQATRVLDATVAEREATMLDILNKRSALRKLLADPICKNPNIKVVADLARDVLRRFPSSVIEMEAVYEELVKLMTATDPWFASLRLIQAAVGKYLPCCPECGKPWTNDPDPSSLGLACKNDHRGPGRGPRPVFRLLDQDGTIACRVFVSKERGWVQMHYLWPERPITQVSPR